MNLGITSRKKGLKVKQNLQKDEYSMENLDEFFQDEEESFISSRRRSSKSSILPYPKEEFHKRTTGYNVGPAGVSALYSSFDKDGFKIPSTVPEAGTSQVPREKTPERNSNLLPDYAGYPDVQDDMDPGLYEENIPNHSDESFVTPPKLPREQRRFVRRARVEDEDSEDSYSINLTPDGKEGGDYRDVPELVNDADTTKDESFHTSDNALLEDELDDDFQVDLEDEEEDREYIEGESALHGSSSSDSEESSSDTDSGEDEAALSEGRRARARADNISVSEVYDSDEDYIQSQAKDLLTENNLDSRRGGRRRSNRVRVAPLEYWRNEKIVYKRKSDKPILEIDKIVTYEHEDDEEEEELMKKKKKKPAEKTKTRSYNYIPTGKPRGRPRKQNLLVEKDINLDPNVSILEEIKEGTYPNSTWLKYGILRGKVNVSEDNTQMEEIIAFGPGLSQTEQKTETPQDKYTLSILFDKHRERFASGTLRIPIDGEKDRANSNNAFITFYLIEGIVDVSINGHNFVCTSGSSFQIPAFNTYSFSNKGKGEVKLFFVQITVPEDFNGAADSVSEVTEDPEEEQDEEQTQPTQENALFLTKSSSDMSLTST